MDHHAGCFWLSSSFVSFLSPLSTLTDCIWSASFCFPSVECQSSKSRVRIPPTSLSTISSALGQCSSFQPFVEAVLYVLLLGNHDRDLLIWIIWLVDFDSSFCSLCRNICVNNCRRDGKQIVAIGICTSIADHADVPTRSSVEIRLVLEGNPRINQVGSI